MQGVGKRDISTGEAGKRRGAQPGLREGAEGPPSQTWPPAPCLLGQAPGPVGPEAFLRRSRGSRPGCGVGSRRTPPELTADQWLPGSGHRDRRRRHVLAGGQLAAGHPQHARHRSPAARPRNLQSPVQMQARSPLFESNYFQDDRDGSHPPKKENNKCWQGRKETERLEPWGQPRKRPGAPQKGDVTRQVHSGSAPADLSAGARAGNCTTLSAARLTAATGGSDPSGRRRATSHTHRGLFLPRNIHSLESEGRADTGYDGGEPRAPCSTWRPPGTRGRMPSEPT